MHIAWPNIRRWFVFQRPLHRRTLLGLVVLLILGLLHGVILRLLAWPLDAGDAWAAGDCFCIHGNELGSDGFEPFAAAAAWHGRAAGRKILLLLPHTARIVEIGAVRSFEEACRGQLVKQGIPPEDIWPIPADALDVWGEAHAMAKWLKEHPGATVVLAGSPFGSRRLRYVFDKVLGPVDAKRLRLATLPDPASPMGCWWRSRGGVKDFMYAWLELGYAWVAGESAGPYPANAALFQADIQAQNR